MTSFAIDARAARGFAVAIAAERGAPPPVAAATPPKLQAVPASTLRAGDVAIGEADIGGAIGLSLEKLLEGPLLVQGVPGAGKSWTLRRLLEQTRGRVQHVIVDPEGEFGNVAEWLGCLRLDAARLDIASVAKAAARAREHRLSVLLDVSQLERERQMQMVAAFLRALVEAPREHWSPALVVIDEAHLFAPYGGHVSEAVETRKQSTGALVDLMSRGRKRGLAGVLATQRLARLATSVRSNAHNFMVGLNTLDLDIRRAAEMIGWDARKAFDRLPMLAPGDFVAVGAAFSRSPCVLRVGAVETAHRGARPELTAPPRLGAGDAARLIALDELVEASAVDAAAIAENVLQPGMRAVRAFIRDPAFALAARVHGALAPLAPDGALFDQLAAHLETPIGDVAAALALLDHHGVVEFSGHGFERAARLRPGMAQHG